MSVLVGDALTRLRELPDASAQMCITSPPYWGLRDYGTATWEGGEAGCDHRPSDEAGSTNKPSAGQREHAGRFAGPMCWRCGARRVDAQLGLEPTPEAYVAAQAVAEERRAIRALVVRLGVAEDAFDDAAVSGRPCPEDHALHGETEFYFNNSGEGWQAYHALSDAIESLDAALRQRATPTPDGEEK